MPANKVTGRGGKREGSGPKPLPPEARQTHASIRLTPEQLKQLKRIGNGNLSEGIRRLLSRYDTLINLWKHNVTLAQNALAVARHFDAPTEPFEQQVAEAQAKLEQFQAEYELVSTINPSD